jgi:hypothetical protein
MATQYLTARDLIRRATHGSGVALQHWIFRLTQRPRSILWKSPAASSEVSNFVQT